MSFRFLDLPAEMRNRIYDCVADSIEETPILLANRNEAEKETPRPGFAGAPHKQALCDLAKPTKHRHVFALLLVCRQITSEARTIVDEAAGRSGLDLRFAMLTSSLRKMEQLRELWTPNLYLIKHLAVEQEVFWLLIVAQTKKEVCRCEWLWKALYRSGHNVQNVHRLGKLLPNIESMTVYPLRKLVERAEHLHSGDMVAFNLADERRRSFLHKAFPRLLDIKRVGEFDCKRFKKERDHWQCWYTGEPLSL